MLQLQQDVFGLLMSADALKNVNIVLWRKMRVASEIEWNTIWQSNRNGRSGAGILVRMPGIIVEHQNLPSEERVTISVSVVEEPNLNKTPETGTLIEAEDLAMLVRDLLHGECIYGLAELVSAKNAIQDDADFPELLAYKVNFELVMLRLKTQRCDPPTIADDGSGNATLTNGANTPGAEIFYTLDGTLPCNASALDPISGMSINAASTLYTGAISIPSGETKTIRWVAYQLGFNPSFVQQADVTNNA